MPFDQQAYMQQYVQRHLAEFRSYGKKSRQKRRDWLNGVKADAGCRRCGNKDFRVLDFHHIDPSQKSINFGDSNRSSLEMLKTEIEKCEVLCANCHRIEEYERRNKEAS